MKKILVIFAFAVVLLLAFSNYQGLAFISPLQSPIEIPPLENCKIMCVTDYPRCYQKCEFLYGEKESCVDVENQEEKSHQTSRQEIPLFILERRWPIPNINPGNTICTYFTDGTKFCR